MDELFTLRTYMFHLSIFGAAAALLSRMLLGNTALRKRKRDPRLHVITLHHFRPLNSWVPSYTRTVLVNTIMQVDFHIL